MKVHIIKWKSIEEFVFEHARSKVSFEKFRASIKKVDWKSINDVQETFGTADLISNDRMVFNIGGNNYRLICGFGLDPRWFIYM